MNSNQPKDLRWDPYLMYHGTDFSTFWVEHLNSKQRKLLYILGSGFDPRMPQGLEALVNCGGTSTIDGLIVNFEEGSNSPSNQYADLKRDNLARIRDLIGDRGEITDHPVPMWSSAGLGRRRIGSRRAAEIFTNGSTLVDFTDILIDISAMPRGIFFPLIGKTIALIDQLKSENGDAINLHVVVAEDVVLDHLIIETGIDDTASYVYGFASNLELEATADEPKVWIPVLGENQSEQLSKIYNLVSPDEICPLLPWPSIDPRRRDDLLVEYRELLFDQWQVEPGNIFYASERNPFEVYRQIFRVANHYHRALKPLGGCKTVVSALSSKLLSIGAMLAAYEAISITELSIAMAHIEAQGYEVDINYLMTDQVDLFNLWLTGDCYEH